MKKSFSQRKLPKQKREKVSESSDSTQKESIRVHRTVFVGPSFSSQTYFIGKILEKLVFGE